MGISALESLYIPLTEIGVDYDPNPEGHLPSASYPQETHPNELTRYLWEHPSNIDKQRLSNLMHEFQPKMQETVLQVDIDQGSMDPPAVGAADPRMADGYVRLMPQETSKGLSVCFMFDSELPEPYGNGAMSCLMEDGGIGVYVESVYYEMAGQEKERMLVNMGTIIDAYFLGVSELAREIVQGTKKLQAPGMAVPKEDRIEKSGLWDAIQKTRAESEEIYRENNLPNW